jgi:thiol-disulfide isomerase/thioredoxin
MPVARYPHLLAFCFCICSLFCYHQTNAQVTKLKTGIRFQAGDFQAALAKAKSVNKPIFVEVYLTGCPHCDALAPVLEEKAVGDFYNANFISWKTEANSKESTAFQKEKGITYPEFPLFFFFDANGDLILQSCGAHAPSGFYSGSFDTWKNSTESVATYGKLPCKVRLRRQGPDVFNRLREIQQGR